MKYNNLFLLHFSSLLLITGCKGIQTTKDAQNNITKDIVVNAAPYVENIGIAKTIHTTVSLGEEPKDVYLLLSNTVSTDGSLNISSNAKRIEKRVKNQNNTDLLTQTVHAPSEVELFRKNIKTYLDKQINTSDTYSQSSTKTTQKVVEGKEKLFYTDKSAKQSTKATARKVISVSTTYGVKTLSIWVSNDTFGTGCTKVKCLTQGMIDALADSFLKSGGDNDVYDWVTNVYGQEWGTHSNNKLIANTNEISILLTDIDNDNSQTGGVVGYFYPKDNFKKESIAGSNEQIMLYADAVLFANGNAEWSMDNFWPREMISTLAHEFQHMIHFYQKSVLLTDESTDTWINEMLSESTEDLVASKIHHTGSRGVDYRIGSAGEKGNILGRYPLFNANNMLSLTTWNARSANYATVNAFGAFLLRNYGGAKVLHDIVHNNLTDEQAIIKAIQKTPQGQGKTFNDLLKEWGTAVLLSDHDNLGADMPHYNTGGYMTNQYNQSTYDLGSINFFNYNPPPHVSSSVGTVKGNANYYYKVGSNLTGKINIDLTLNGRVETTLIIK